MKRLKAIDPGIEIVMLTGYGTKQRALQVMKLGAHDYMAKPFDIQCVRETVRKCFALRDLSCEVARLRQEVAQEEARRIAKKSD